MPSHFNHKLAQWTRQVLEEQGGLSLRQAELRTGVSYATVKGMLEGRRIAAETLIRFAAAFDYDIPEALRIADYEDLALLWEPNRTGAMGAPEPELEPEDAEVPEILAAYRGLPLELRAGIKAMILAAHQEHQRNQTTHGKRAK